MFEVAPKLGEGDGADFANTRAEVAWMAEVNRTTGRPVTFGVAQTDFRPGLFEHVLAFVDEEVATGAMLRPQTTPRGIGLLFGLQARTFFDGLPAWKALRSARPHGAAGRAARRHAPGDARAGSGRQRRRRSPGTRVYYLGTETPDYCFTPDRQPGRAGGAGR